MKTSVTKIMMSFALMGCLIFSASDAMAQGRSRSQGGSSASRSQSAAVSRSSNSSAPSVSRSSSSSSMSRSAATPQVSRSNSSTSHSATAPKVDRMSSSSTSHSATTPQVTQRSSSSSRSGDTGTRVNRGATTRGGSDRGTTTTTTGSTTRRTDTSIGHMGSTTKSDHSGSIGTTSMQTRQGSTTKPNGNRPNGGNGGMDKPNGNMDKPNKPNGGNGGMDKPNGGNGGVDKPNKPNGGNGTPGGNNDRHGDKGGNHGNKGGFDRHGDKGGNHGGKGGFDRHGDKGGNKGNHRGFDPKNRYDYSGHHYRNEFSLNYRNHNWSRPLPPPAHGYRIAPWAWYRPVIPVGWHPYAGAPVIDRILGLVFGSLYNTSLDYLYSNGYYIDGYADGIIYLRDVPMLNLYWPDVMLNYDYDRLVNAQFVYHSSYYDTSRYDRVYRSLCRIYGTPVYRDGMTISWYGGDSRGYVTLSMNESYGDYYTTMSIGY